jgi:hypothetical protein
LASHCKTNQRTMEADSIVATLEGKRAELEAELAQMSASLGELGAISFG